MAALTPRTLTRNSHNFDLPSLVTAITSCLQALNPQDYNLNRLNPSLLNQFSSHLDSALVFEVIKTQANPYHGLFFFNWASNPIPNPNNYSHTNRCYTAITDLLLSHSLFATASALLESSNRFSDFTVSKFITAYGNRGNVKAAIFWFHRAKAASNGNCLLSYNAILGVLVKAGKISLAKTFFDQIMECAVAVRPDASTYTTMIRGYCKMGMLDNARKVFDEMLCEPNLVTYNTMINGYCKKGDMDKAMVIFYRLMASRDCLPDTITYTTLIDGYCKKGEFDEAMKWMSEMDLRGSKPNLLTYNAVIYGLCLRGNVDEAKRMMTKMRLDGVKENLATHMSILKGLCIAEKSAETVLYFKEMVRKGMKPDAKAFGVVINAHCKMKKPKDAISLLIEMKAKGLHPSVSSFNAVFRVLLELGELDTAVNLLKQMSKMGCAPNFISYSTVICGLCGAKGRMQEVEQCLNNMIQSGFDIDSTIYGFLIEGYCVNGNNEKAMRVFYEAIGRNYVISTKSFLVFVKHLCQKGEAADAQTIFEDMCVRSSVVDVESYRRILNEQLNIQTEKVWGEV